MNCIFYDFLKVALGNKAFLDSILSSKEWEELFILAKKQALTGICFSGIERLPKEQKPPRGLLMQWWGLTNQIEARNGRMNVATREVWDSFVHQGYRAVILKGQGNALWYPQPQRRQPGDVDIWVTTGDAPYNSAASREKVIRMVKQRFPEKLANMKHIHYPIFHDVDVEVHFQPGVMSGWMINRRLQEFFTREIGKGEKVKLEVSSNQDGHITVPSWDMNAVFLLVHLFNHFMYEGVGMRQMVDYYYFLIKGYENIDREYVQRTINSIHLKSFCRAVMWVLHEILGLDEKYLLTEMDIARGQLLLDEIMAGGNFGHYDIRYWNPEDSLWQHYWKRMKRQLSFFRYYPSEVLATPLFLIYQRIWMLSQNK